MSKTVSRWFVVMLIGMALSPEYFSGHDDNPKICTLDRAHEDARAVFKKYNP